jgi:DNA repair photolyase
MIKEVKAKSILRRHKKIDSWFLSHYGINLYRGCTHDCVYCDGRNEKYQVGGEYGKEVSVKVNAIELLDRELDPSRKRKPMPRGFIIICGGVSDAYQPVEAKYKLARKTLELIYRHNYPVHILTKSTLVERDLDLLKKINRQAKSLVCFSFSSVNDEISKIFEPSVPSPSKRLKTIKRLKQAGIACGMYLLPVIPFITDTPKMMEHTLKKSQDAGIDFIIFGTMTLKEGVQKQYFMKMLKKHFPKLVTQYETTYSQSSQWGEASFNYNTSVHKLFNQLATDYHIPKRIPPSIYKYWINKQDLILVILEHLDYLLKLNNRKSPYGYAAYSLSKLKAPIENLCTKELLKIRGVGPATVKIIKEIIQTGTCSLYEGLL